jgi:hypothetical protein
VESPLVDLRHHLAELECRAGNWDAAMVHARESVTAAQRQAGGFRLGPLRGGPGRAPGASSRRGKKRSKGCGSPRRPTSSSLRSEPGRPGFRRALPGPNSALS